MYGYIMYEILFCTSIIINLAAVRIFEVLCYKFNVSVTNTDFILK
jgi:hypothetical protein